jgi:hypothetical protein
MLASTRPWTPLLLLADPFPGCAQNFFETLHVHACLFSQEFCANPVHVSTNRKKEFHTRFSYAFSELKMPLMLSTKNL